MFQEAVLPRRLRIVAGLSQTNRDGRVTSIWVLRIILNAYYRHILAASFYMEGAFQKAEVDTLDTMCDGFTKRFGAAVCPKLPFEQFLAKRTPFAKTSFKLDQLYAFFGLNEDPFIDLKISYEISTQDALVSTTQSIIRATLRLDIFECSNDNTNDLPSWVPDFYIKATKSPFLRSIICGEWHSPRAISNLWLGSCDNKVLRAFGRPKPKYSLHLARLQ